MTENQKKLMKILEVMFQFDQADLDFGIYRIMAMKREDIKRFLNKDLMAQITTDLELLLNINGANELNRVNKEIEDARAMAVSDAIKTAMIAGLEEKKKTLNSKDSIADVEGDIYSHLTNFFERYYDNGDFISQRRYKDGAYAIPYEGEEIKLHWANSDQYYIKTSEYFKDYIFKTGYGNSVHFKIVEVETENDNNKANEKRFFQLYTLKPFDVIDKELIIYFEYKNGGKKNQNECMAEVITAFSEAASVYQDYSSLLAVKDGKSLLERQLIIYTARNTFDYFIHKDLGKFLNRELDFYIKNDVIFLDDIEEQNDGKTKQYLVKAKVIRKIARKIIAFLAQIEDFQKKLWLKKKFVVETNYCITLDRVPKKFYDEIIANTAQIEEWKKLFSIHEIEGDLSTAAYSEPLTKEFLEKNKFLVLDTAFFSDEFKEKLIESIDDLDENLDGLLVHSENFQALNLVQERYKNQIKCIYIDPPYNTGGDGFFFKDNYKHSSWMTMIVDRLRMCYKILKDDGVMYSSIDAVERSRLEAALNICFDADNRVEEIIWAQNTTKNQSPTFSTNHEYVEVYAKNLEVVKKDFSMFRESKPGYNEIMELITEINATYPSIKETEKALRGMYSTRKARLKAEGLIDLEDEWKSIYNYNRVEYRDENGRYVPDNLAVSKKAKMWVWREVDTSMPQVKEDSQKEEFRDPNSPTYRFYTPIHPITGKPSQPPKTGWRWPYDAYGKQQNYFLKLVNDNRIVWGDDEKKIPQQKSFLHEVETNVAKSVVNDYADGEKELTNLFGKSRSFSNPKPTTLIKRFFLQSSTENNIVCDFFAGSGTAGHATIDLNRDDNENRKFILVEMGEYFDTVIKPRIEKVIYSEDWKDGKPVSRKGLSHAFKYIRLESYEDTLNNLKMVDEQIALPVDLSEQYLINYMLDIETKGSESLINIDKFDKPFDYSMNITRKLKSAPCNIDLVETFNYLIGLKVERNYALVRFDADFKEGEYGAITATIKDGNTYKIKIIEGITLAGDSTLIIWRELTGNTINDNAVLDAFFAKKKLSTTDFEYKKVYVNGDNNLPNIRAENEGWKVILIEEEMKKRMFENVI
ncbi:MAG: site-specific DNA-methyltransferase [Desulfosporosinus sp.]|nr:site-specific DNA-methyltransferase [Desulfosporosinus sp.]